MQSKEKYAKQTPFVLAVVVNWNGGEDLLQCVASIAASEYPKDKYKIAVVDNASADGSCEALSRSYPDILIFENDKNVGYVKAANQGFSYAERTGADYVWLFNNDVVVNAGTLSRLVAVGEEDESIGVIAPAVYPLDAPEEAPHVGYKINFWTGALKKLNSSVFVGFRGRYTDVDTVLGCSNLIKTTVLKKIGTFRAAYELYFEETDFNVRARRGGFRVVVVPEAKVWHKNAATMDRFILRRAFLLLRNLFLFELFNARPWHLVVFIPYYFLVHLPIFMVRGTFYALKLIGGRRVTRQA